MGQASFVQQLKALLHRNWTLKLRNRNSTLQVFRNYYFICSWYGFEVKVGMHSIGFVKTKRVSIISVKILQKCLALITGCTLVQPCVNGDTSFQWEVL